MFKLIDRSGREKKREKVRLEATQVDEAEKDANLATQAAARNSL